MSSLLSFVSDGTQGSVVCRRDDIADGQLMLPRGERSHCNNRVYIFMEPRILKLMHEYLFWVISAKVVACVKAVYKKKITANLAA